MERLQIFYQGVSKGSYGSRGDGNASSCILLDVGWDRQDLSWEHHLLNESDGVETGEVPVWVPESHRFSAAEMIAG